MLVQEDGLDGPTTEPGGVFRFKVENLPEVPQLVLVAADQAVQNVDPGEPQHLLQVTAGHARIAVDHGQGVAIHHAAPFCSSAAWARTRSR